jgi:anhydro-N-acetylmuramic acid kinase
MKDDGLLVVGLMSGTSADGVDAALVRIRGHGQSLSVTPIAFQALPYSVALQQRILAASTTGTVSEICHLNVLLGELFGRAALRVMKAARCKPSEIHLIGSHGQTIQHRPMPIYESGVGPLRSTLQIAEPAVIAERTGVTTVADFRPRDMAAGGQGAPLTPYAHYLLLRHPRRARLIVNLGGISNVTYLPAGGALKAVQAFDTGPGNMVLDGLVRHTTGGRLKMDAEGRLASGGEVHRGLLARLLRHSYFRRRPPKSTGREVFGDTFLKQVLKVGAGLTPRDLLATCSFFTARTVGDARRWLSGAVDEVVLCGGGARNKTLVRHLGEVFAPAPVRTLENIGWESKSFEAIAFAVLAYQTVRGECSNVPAATGATHPVVLGVIVPGKDLRWRPTFKL